MPTRHTITMSILNPVTGTLRLSPRETTARWGDNVSWVMGPGIQSFQIIEKPGNSRYIFTRPLPVGQAPTLNLTVSTRIPNCDWYYSIIWINAATGVPRTHDPKISVRPSKSFLSTNFFRISIIAISALFSILFAARFLKRKSKGNISEKNDAYRGI